MNNWFVCDPHMITWVRELVKSTVALPDLETHSRHIDMRILSNPIEIVVELALYIHRGKRI